MNNLFKKSLISIIVLLSLSIGVNALQSNITVSGGWTTAAGQTEYMGVHFRNEYGLNITNLTVTKNATDTSTRALLYSATSTGITASIANATYVGNTATFNSSFAGANITNNDYFVILSGSTGHAAYTQVYKAYTYPQTSNGIRFVNRSRATVADAYIFGGSFVESMFELNFSTIGVAVPANLTFSNISLVNNTYSSEVALIINTTVLNTSTNSNVNQTYYLYNSGTLIQSGQYATNNVTGRVNITGLSDGIYTVWFFAKNNQTNVSSNNYTFTKDTVAPTISNNILSQYNYYTNNNLNSSCSDTNLLSCNISMNSQIRNLSGLFNFTLNGNLTYNITARDLAGNILSATGVTLVNPYAYFYFNSTTLISNFTFGGVNIIGQYANFTIYNSYLSLGNNTLLFEKLGYASTNVTFTVNTSSNINLTTPITQSTIILTIYDRETFLVINTSTSTVSLIATTGYNATTTTGYVNISNINFINEVYTILVSNPSYGTENNYFTYSNQELLNINMYLLNITSSDAGYMVIKVISENSERITDAQCSLLEWRPDLSSYVTVAQGITNINGEYTFNVEIGSKFYKISCTKATVTAISSVQVFTTTGITLPLILTETSTLLPASSLIGFSYSLYNTSVNSTHDKINFTFSSSSGLISTNCLKHYGVLGINPTLINSTCVNTSVGQIILYVNRNQTYNQIIYATGTDTNGISVNIDRIMYDGTNSLATSLKNYHFDIVLPLILTLLGIILGLTTKPMNIFLSMIGAIIGVWVSVLLVSSVISSSIAIFITLIAILMIWGASKPK